LTAGIPSLLVPNGSGTPEIAKLCVAAGAAVSLGTHCTVTEIDHGLDAIARLLRGPRSLQAEFARYDGPECCAEYIERAAAPEPGDNIEAPEAGADCAQITY
jgi:hypothetical protein